MTLLAPHEGQGLGCRFEDFVVGDKGLVFRVEGLGFMV